MGTTLGLSSASIIGEMYLISLYVIKFVSDMSAGL